MHDLSFLIPYRDRKHNLEQLIPKLKQFMHKNHSDVDYKIYVIEQCNRKLFNKGKLLNVGFIETEDDGASHICLHDIDMMPLNKNCDYSPANKVKHLACKVQQFKYILPYSDYYGGVLVLPKDIFSTIGGFSNQFWGWGGEDDNFAIRCKINGFEIERTWGEYLSLPHKRDRQKIYPAMIIKNNPKNKHILGRYMDNGLDNPKYDLVTYRKRKDYTLISVDIK